MKKTIQPILSSLALGLGALQGSPTIQTGFNAIEADIDNQQRLYINVGVTGEHNDAMFHSTNIINKGNPFSSHRVSVGNSSYTLRPLAQIKTNYEGFTDARGGLRINSHPFADFGWMELTTNGKSLELTGLAGVVIKVPVVGTVTTELLNQLTLNDSNVSYSFELQAMKQVGDFSVFGRVGARDFKNPSYTIGVRRQF